MMMMMRRRRSRPRVPGGAPGALHKRATVLPSGWRGEVRTCRLRFFRWEAFLV